MRIFYGMKTRVFSPRHLFLTAMLRQPRILSAVTLAFLQCHFHADAAPGDRDWSFNFSGVSSTYPGAFLNSARVSSVAIQPDGKIVAVGHISPWFLTGAGVARVGTNGTVDPDFAPDARMFGKLVTTREDGKLVVDGASPLDNADGTTLLDKDGTTLSRLPGLSGAVKELNAVAIQTDGKMLLAGEFSPLPGTFRPIGLLRLNADGSRDSTFIPFLDPVKCLALQLDGKILVAGSSLFRLNPDGDWDDSFQAGAVGAVYGVTVQADGKILVVSSSNPTLTRLNPDGTRDPGFVVTQELGTCLSITLQADGKILLASAGFISVRGIGEQVFRLNGDGSLDETFVLAGWPDYASGLGGGGGVSVLAVRTAVLGATLQADGKVLAWWALPPGNMGHDYEALERYWNDPATQDLSVPDTTRIRWLRGGSAPEAQYARFELSQDGGATWRALGLPARIPGGWELAGLKLPPSGIVRARARVITGPYNGSSGLVETTVVYPPGAPLLAQPGKNANEFRFSFATMTNRIYRVQFTPDLSPGVAWQTILTVTGDGGTSLIAVPATPSAGFYRVTLDL